MCIADVTGSFIPWAEKTTTSVEPTSKYTLNDKNNYRTCTLTLTVYMHLSI